ncbi:MAG: AmmeMemoRadiSam system protein B [Planctomycetota bacterium]
MTDQSPPAFDPEAAHHARPKLRRIRAFPLPAKTPDGKDVQMLGLADAQQISPKIVGMQPAMQLVLPHMNGENTIDEIATTVGRGLTAEMLRPIVAQLDDAGLLHGPSFDAIYAEMKSAFDGSDTLPPGSTVQFAEALVMQELGQDASEEDRARLAPEKLRAAIDSWIDTALKDADDPTFDKLPAAVVAPHIDYQRGWMNYAHVYGRLRVVDRPDRVVILGTNHFGMSTGVCGCDKAYETPLGTTPLDTELLEAVKGKLGEADAQKLLEHRYDHEREHSIELHLPWIQHCLGTDDSGAHVPVFAALVHDPCVNGGESYDGNGLGFEPFVEALKGALNDVGGKTLIVSSADLSHVGPAFGDQQSLAGDSAEAQSARDRVSSHDREMLAHVTLGNADDLVSSMAWQQNPTRWCSIGNIAATLKVVEPGEIRLLNYGAAMDQNGVTLVSHAAIAMN